jgi:hypothetical protein
MGFISGSFGGVPCEFELLSCIEGAVFSSAGLFSWNVLGGWADSVEGALVEGELIAGADGDGLWMMGASGPPVITA